MLIIISFVTFDSLYNKKGLFPGNTETDLFYLVFIANNLRD